MQVFAERTVAKFGVTRGKCVPAVVDLKLEVFDKDEPDVDEYFRLFVGRVFDVAGKPDSPGHSGRGSGGGKILCST